LPDPEAYKVNILTGLTWVDFIIISGVIVFAKATLRNLVGEILE